MVGLLARKKMQKAIKELIAKARAKRVKELFSSLEDFRKTAEKISEDEQEEYTKYFTKYFDHELRLLNIEGRKIEMNYKEIIFRTDQQASKFNERLAQPDLDKSMRNFYRKEYLNILKPQYVIAQVLDNFRKYIEVLKIIEEEFSEWFFLGRLDYLKELLQPYIVMSEEKKQKEIWIYKKYEKELEIERKEEMFKRAGISLKKEK
jgi:hypothetical protein